LYESPEFHAVKEVDELFMIALNINLIDAAFHIVSFAEGEQKDEMFSGLNDLAIGSPIRHS
jgi:hypothetical protein